MKKFIAFFLLVATVLSIYGTRQIINDENVVPRTLSGNFNAIRIENAIEVYLSPSNTFSMAVSGASEEARNAIKTEIVEGELRITIMGRGSSLWNKKGQGRQRVYISCPTLERIYLGGASNIKLMSKLKAASLKIQLTGASDFKGSIEAETLLAELSGASDAIFGVGSVKNLKLNASGASTFNGFDLNAQDCVVEASGASDVKVKAENSFKIHANGASTVLYRGTGVPREIRSTGASDVKRKEAPTREV